MIQENTIKTLANGTTIKTEVIKSSDNVSGEDEKPTLEVTENAPTK